MTAESEHFWFKPRRYGYGAAPFTWQGWALSGLFVVSVLVVAYAIATAMIGLWPGFFAVAALAVAFVAIVRIKSSGVWRWRWGQEA